MAVDIVSKFELERLAAEIQQEIEMKDMLEQSIQELLVTVEELEKCSEVIKDEGNEWKTRFETQEEMNQQLQQQIIILMEKVEEAKANFKESVHTSRDINNYVDNNEITPQYVKMLEKEKNSLANQLRDMEWRLDQESKAYHKANDERKRCMLEINVTKSSQEDMKMRHRANQLANVSSRTEDQADQLYSPKLQRDVDGNIRENHRVLDPRKGPIKKTAGVHTLPSLDQDGC
ncbi:unnamed protein product [Acanthosepion pharaonis]|uniref:Coiled-coil domain-containing protein 169 n=1 Tax=Acanthosepion pharaonis TaxID=158019 RepID=A0A812BDK6_ACAPH|nr:unnamed protein product [Sepia pharaonis]